MLDLTALLGTAGHAAGHAAQAAAALSASTLTNRLPCREKAAKEIKTDQKKYIQRYQNAQRATRDPQVSYEKCWNVSYIKRNLEKSHLGKSHPTNPYKPCTSHAPAMLARSHTANAPHPPETYPSPSSSFPEARNVTEYTDRMSKILLSL